MVHKRYFFDSVRQSLFGGKLTQAQVDGLNILLAEGERREMDFLQLSYVFSITYHDTGKTIQPISEYGKGQGQPYGVPDPQTGQAYYGRGYVQLTWRDNYARMAPICHAPLVEQADLALDPVIACTVIYVGMEQGTFTGRCLGDYFTDTLTDWVNARRIVNALDRAEEIAGYARLFHDALSWTPGAGHG